MKKKCMKYGPNRNINHSAKTTVRGNHAMYNEWRPFQYVLLIIGLFITLALLTTTFSGCSTGPKYNAPVGAGADGLISVGGAESKTDEYVRITREIGDTLSGLRGELTGAVAGGTDLQGLLQIYVRRVADLERAYNDLANALSGQLETQP